MTRTRLTALALAAALAAAFALPAGTASAGKKKKSGPVVVGTDEAGDWGANQDPELGPLGDVLGQDLTSATIELAEDGKTLNFIIGVNALPALGGVPEVSRYTWDFIVDKNEVMEIDGKFTNYSRGACDPTSGQCPPPRDPGTQPFLIRGECRVEAVGVNFTICEELARVQGVFDPTEGTITVPVPLDAIKAKPGSKIVGSPGTFGGTISAAPAAFATMSSFPMDLLTTTGTYVVPKK